MTGIAVGHRFTAFLFAAGAFVAAMAGGAVTLAVVAALAVFTGAFGIIAF